MSRLKRGVDWTTEYAAVAHRIGTTWDLANDVLDQMVHPNLMTDSATLSNVRERLATVREELAGILNNRNELLRVVVLVLEAESNGIDIQALGVLESLGTERQKATLDRLEVVLQATIERRARQRNSRRENANYHHKTKQRH